jgi:uncharacterized protein YcbK (DUF882 family)
MAQGSRASAERGRSKRGLLFRGLLLMAAALAPGSMVCSLATAEETPAPGIAIPEPKPEIRTIHMRHHWLRQSLDLVYKIGDEYQPEAMAEISRFMRDWHCDKTVAIDPKLVDRLYELQQSIGPKRTIRLISGYRSEGYNASLLAAGRVVDPHSQHMFGRAADIFVPGMSADRVREAAEEQEQGGVGYYPFSGPRFVHIDTGPERRWTETDPAVRRKLGLRSHPGRKFKLDCSLTMEQAVEEISPLKVFAALPQGAVVAPDPMQGGATATATAVSAERTAVTIVRSGLEDHERFCKIAGASAPEELQLLDPGHPLMPSTPRL